MSANIKTWQERLKGRVSAGMTMQLQMNNQAMQAEIADLRAALAATAPTVAVDEREAFEAWFSENIYSNPLCLTLRYDDPNTYTSDTAEARWIGWQARAKLSAGAAISAGWALVPVEPTIDMKDAPCVKVGGCYSCSPEQVGYSDCAEIYKAMVAAAPTPDQQGENIP